MDLGDATPRGCIFEAEHFAKQILSRSERMILALLYLSIFSQWLFQFASVWLWHPRFWRQKSTQCHCLWGAFAEFLTLDFRAWPRRNRTSCFSDHLFSFSEMEVNWSSRLRTQQNISMQVVGSCLCLCSRMLGGAFASKLDKAVIQNVIHAAIFRYI